MTFLGLTSYQEYCQYLLQQQEEWKELDTYCRITISRFYRDKRVFDLLQSDVLPSFKQESALSCWCAGISSGEEPYTLAMLLKENQRRYHPILATDIDALMVQRARQACYPESALKELPAPWRKRYFTSGSEMCLRKEIKQMVDFRIQDVRSRLPAGPFHIIFCRNLIAMYLDRTQQKTLFTDIAGRMHAGGVLILGKHEKLPDQIHAFAPWFAGENIYRKR